jgi:hypothetical protein
LHLQNTTSLVVYQARLTERLPHLVQRRKIPVEWRLSALALDGIGRKEGDASRAASRG